MQIEIDAKTILGLLLFVPLYGIWLKLGAGGKTDEPSLPGSVTSSQPTNTKKRKNKKKGKGNDKPAVPSTAPPNVLPTKPDDKRVPTPVSQVNQSTSSDDSREPWISPPPAVLTASTGTTTVTTNRNNHKKKSKGSELSKEEFPPLKSATKLADNKANQPLPSAETARAEPVSKSRGPDGGIRQPKDREIDEDETTPVRVIKVVSEPEYAPESEDSAETRKDAEDGWVKVPTGPRTLRITSSRSSTAPRLKPASASATQVEETKKQRENRRKAERRREQKEAGREVQEERMRNHKRTMVGVRMTELAKEDAARKRKSSASRMDGVTGLLWD